MIKTDTENVLCMASASQPMLGVHPAVLLRRNCLAHVLQRASRTLA
jgi:hypothetical protein